MQDVAIRAAGEEWGGPEEGTRRGLGGPQEALEGSARLAVCPPPTDAEFDSAFRRLEADALIHCEIDAMGVKRWCITSVGRAALAEC